MVSLELEKIGSSSPWVARITGTDPKYGLARSFENGIRDYSRANKPKTRGVYTSYNLGDGIYEVNDPHSWGKTARYFIRVVGDESTKIEASEVRAAISNESVVS